MNENFWRESFKDPLVSDCLVRTHSFRRIPFQAPLNEINKGLILRSKHIVKNFSARFSNFAISWTWTDLFGHIFVIKELSFPLWLLQNLSRWNATNFHDQAQLIRFVFSRENWISHCKFGHNTPKRPHVDAGRVRDSQNYFGGSIKARLDIRIHAFVLETGRTEVNYFDSTLWGVLQ